MAIFDSRVQVNHVRMLQGCPGGPNTECEPHFIVQRIYSLTSAVQTWSVETEIQFMHWYCLQVCVASTPVPTFKCCFVVVGSPTRGLDRCLIFLRVRCQLWALPKNQVIAGLHRIGLRTADR